LQVDYGVVNGGQVNLSVYSVTGALIHRLVDQSQAPGLYTLYWDGADDKGSPSSTGLYFVLLRDGNRTIIKKVVVNKQ